MKKIAIIELQEHQEILFGYIELLLVQDLHLCVFAPDFMHKQSKSEWLNNPKLSWHLRSDLESGSEFVQRNWEAINATDLILFTTLIRDFAFFANAIFRPPTILLIIKGNFFLAPNRNIQLSNFKDGLRYLARIIRRDDYFRKKLLEKFDYLSLGEPLLLEYLKPFVPSRCNFLPELPYTFCTPTSVVNNPVQIVIPGTVSNLIRDFDALRASLQLADPFFKTPVNCIFLGNAGTLRAKPILKWVQELEFQNISIQTFQNMVPEHQYLKILRQADFLVLPLLEVIRFGVINEYYGKTCLSGGINDMLRFGKPTLLPDFYPLHPTLNQLTRRYQNVDELVQLLLEWVNERAYQTVAESATNLLSSFSKERRSQDLMEILKPAFNFIEK